jgi:uncharacterized membrane protein YdjX (TVP38/TMEM64 family)
MNRLRNPRIVLAVFLAVVLGTVSTGLAIPASRAWFQEHLGEFLASVQQLDAWGPAVVGGAFVPVCLLFLPGSPLTLFGGFAFGGTLAGLAKVTAAVSLGSTLGASLAFLTGRYLARPWIESKVAENPRFRAIDAAVGSQGWKIVLLARLSPIFPFNLLNYAFGVTKVSFRDYVLASWIGMFPGTVMYVYLGSTARQFADVLAGRVEKTAAQQVLFYLGLLATVAVSIYVTRLARRALDTTVPADRGMDLHRASGR